jgi:pimeloyl-ACP methyl ester carboxylesterase
LLLVMGLGGPLIWWDDEFCRQLTSRGFWVIRYDNRDCGRSSRIEGAPRPRPLWSLLGDTRSAAYTLDDMAADAAGLLDHLGVATAHVMGVSMGGMIVQTLAIEHPERVRSLVSIMSTTGRRTVGWASPSVARLLLRMPPRDRIEYVERTVRMLRRISSPGFPFDAERMRRRAEATFDRGLNPVGTARQMVAIAASGDRTEALGRVRAPALVVHGRHARGWRTITPGDEPEGDEDARFAWRRDFQRRLADAGYAAVHWPPEYGGRGATLTESAIFFEELARSGAPLPANALGLLLAGPTIMSAASASPGGRRPLALQARPARHRAARGRRTTPRGARAPGRPQAAASRGVRLCISALPLRPRAPAEPVAT